MKACYFPYNMHKLAMTSAPTSYLKHVQQLEAGLAPYAKRSFEAFSPVLLGGRDAHEHYQRLWAGDARLKLLNRTPLQLERDRILYSDPMRKMTEKYHVLYNGQSRIVRNYTTHTMRMAQVSRSICRALRLNTDFAEAMAIGAKVGAVPFIHAAKEPVSDWAKRTIQAIDRDRTAQRGKEPPPPQLDLELGNAPPPRWFEELTDPNTRSKVLQYLPWAAGDEVDAVYTSGAESYWLLCTNPFVHRAHPSAFYPETMYGVWRHTRGLRPRRDSFHHRCTLDPPGEGRIEIRWDHATYEGTVVQYSDDITWVIENLNDANNAALLNQKQSAVYSQLMSSLSKDIPANLLRAMTHNDAGGIYTYFVADFVTHSGGVLDTLRGGEADRQALRQGDTSSWMGLSPEGEGILDAMTSFLHSHVFQEPRVRNRAAMLRTVAEACVKFLYGGKDEALPRMLEERALLERWSAEDQRHALQLIEDDVHRVQLSIDVLAGMGDQEIYDFVGIQAL